jgi:hypothetical protein
MFMDEIKDYIFHQVFNIEINHRDVISVSQPALFITFCMGIAQSIHREDPPVRARAP